MEKIFVVSYVGISESDYNANGYCKVHAFKSFDAARKEMLSLIEEEKRNIEMMGKEWEILEDNERMFRISWCGHTEQVRIEINETSLL